MTASLSLLHLWRCLAVLLCLFSVNGNVNMVHAQISNSELPLFASSVVHCDEMITLHRWEGSCCSLNVTQGNGCILNVMDGYCNVRGQVWSLEFNSTYDKVPCPASEYTSDMMGMKSTGSSGNDDTSGGGGGVVVAGFGLGAAGVGVSVSGFALAVTTALALAGVVVG